MKIQRTTTIYFKHIIYYYLYYYLLLFNNNNNNNMLVNIVSYYSIRCGRPSSSIHNGKMCHGYVHALVPIAYWFGTSNMSETNDDRHFLKENESGVFHSYDTRHAEHIHGIVLLNTGALQEA